MEMEPSDTAEETAMAEDGNAPSCCRAAITRLQRAFRDRLDRRRRRSEELQALAESERRAREKVTSSKTCSRMRHRAQYKGATALVDRDDPAEETERKRQETGRRRGSGGGRGREWERGGR